MSEAEPITMRAVVFIHIPKTAGTTLRTILSMQVWPIHIQNMYEHGGHAERVSALADLALRRPRQVSAVTGHIGYGIHESLPCGVDYLTILREPIARVTSMYEHIRRTPRHPFHDEVARMTLSDYARSGIDESASNSQTRFLSHVKWAYQLAGRDDEAGYGDLSPEQMLAEAKRNISDEIVATGLSERFDESLLMFQSIFGWSRLYYASLNRRAKPPPDTAISASDRQAVLDANQLDAALYEHAVRVFDRRLVQCVPDHALRLQRFSQRNRYLGPIYTYPARVVQKLREICAR